MTAATNSVTNSGMRAAASAWRKNDLSALGQALCQNPTMMHVGVFLAEEMSPGDQCSIRILRDRLRAERDHYVTDAQLAQAIHRLEQLDCVEQADRPEGVAWFDTPIYVRESAAWIIWQVCRLLAERVAVKVETVEG